MENKETSFLHCFKFHHFGVDTNTITAISTSYAFYLVTIATFKHILSLVRNLIHVKPSRYWGAGFLGVGLIFCVVLIFVLIFGSKATLLIPYLSLSMSGNSLWCLHLSLCMVGGLLLSRWYTRMRNYTPRLMLGQ